MAILMIDVVVHQKSCNSFF